MGKIRTLRGSTEDLAGPPIAILVFRYDGVDLSRGWKIIHASATAAANPSTTSRGIILHTDDQARLPTTMMADNQVIGWAGGLLTSQIDPNHIIVKDLYISPLALAVNYLIVLEEIPITNTENIIYQLKERAQGRIE